jgi:hypothetical protein
MATTAISIAAATGAAAYLNAKYHLGQDIRALKFRRNATKYYEGLGTFLSDYHSSSSIIAGKTRARVLTSFSQNETAIPLVLVRSTSSQMA